MKTILFTAESRGKSKTDWLESYHTFSFGDYHNEERMNFGVMRVLNDDTVKAGTGFDSHSHQNMEIITIPISGSLFHQDHLGNRSTIKKGEVQIMSAGTGIVHSEHNPATAEVVNFFQIWIFPKEKQIMPRYGQKLFSEQDRINQFQCVVSPDERNGSLWINQDAFVYLSKINKEKSLTYTLQNANHGTYVMLVEGNANIAGKDMQRRDAIGITQIEKFEIKTAADTELVVFEVPLN